MNQKRKQICETMKRFKTSEKKINYDKGKKGEGVSTRNDLHI